MQLNYLETQIADAPLEEMTPHRGEDVITRLVIPFLLRKGCLLVKSELMWHDDSCWVLWNACLKGRMKSIRFPLAMIMPKQVKQMQFILLGHETANCCPFSVLSLFIHRSWVESKVTLIVASFFPKGISICFPLWLDLKAVIQGRITGQSSLMRTTSPPEQISVQRAGECFPDCRR